MFKKRERYIHTEVLGGKVYFPQKIHEIKQMTSCFKKILNTSHKSSSRMLVMFYFLIWVVVTQLS